MHIINILLTMLNEMSPYILLGFLFAGVLHAFMSPEIMSRHFSGNGLRQSLKAALLGVPLPLCSCGVLPTAISLRRSGASIAATTSFLIATPQTGVDSIAATYSLLGPAFAVARPIAAFLSAVFGGAVMGRLADDTDGTSFAESAAAQRLKPTFWGRVRDMLYYGFVDMVASVGKWLVIGLIVAALIAALVPDDFFAVFAGYPLLAMVVVVIVAVPMYVCATGSIPIALSLMLKGLTPGTALVFLMAGPAVNFASYTLLSHAMGRRNALLYITIVALSAIGAGLIIDYLLPSAWFVPKMSACVGCCGSGVMWHSSISSMLLCALLFYSLVIRKFTNKTIKTDMAKEYRINGMMCVHCKARVEKELAAVAGVTSVVVDLDKKVAIVHGNHSEQDIADKVNALGYEYIGPADR